MAQQEYQEGQPTPFDLFVHKQRESVQSIDPEEKKRVDKAVAKYEECVRDRQVHYMTRFFRPIPVKEARESAQIECR
jgi:hypothetical protein